jgi:hypothetical protein
MRLRPILAIVLILSLLLGMQSLARATTVEPDLVIADPAGPTNSNFLGRGAWLGQTFPAATSGLLTRVDLHLTPNEATTVTVVLREVDSASGLPTGGSLATTTIAGTVNGWNSAVFAEPYAVTSGIQYAITAIVSDGPSIRWYNDWGLAPIGYYADGQAVECVNPCSRWTVPGTLSGGELFVDDQRMKTYVAVASEPDPTYTFSGFQAPVNPDALNVAKAGQAIPLKFRVTDSTGVAVTNLTAVSVTSVAVACGTVNAASDPVEAYATGKSGLQNLGDGSYQFNWATEKGWANSCRQVRLSLGDGLTHSANFEFKK